MLTKTLASILDQAGIEAEELRSIMKRTMTYTVVLEPDGEGRGYTVRVPALPGCITEGGSKEEALANAHEAIAGFIEALEKAGEPVPEETQPVELVTVAV